MPIVRKGRDPRLITLRRGGTLTDEDHRLLSTWAALCAEHVLHLFEQVQPNDTRPRDAIEAARAWARGELRMSDANAFRRRFGSWSWTTSSGEARSAGTSSTTDDAGARRGVA